MAGFASGITAGKEEENARKKSAQRWDQKPIKSIQRFCNFNNVPTRPGKGVGKPNIGLSVACRGKTTDQADQQGPKNAIDPVSD
jgi:hypothetical protein